MPVKASSIIMISWTILPPGGQGAGRLTRRLRVIIAIEEERHLASFAVGVKCLRRNVIKIHGLIGTEPQYRGLR